ncbi:hypothetical protein BJ987_000418 [Nocardia goodfellowii]|uniref:Uncharacterized protein n=1 Tax=Nocardia goodfellowii TaxID=882446 RepID=A0ABS4Q749_9NOCA|nr:hypothetical protein [Nocardia goodfellowii]
MPATEEDYRCGHRRVLGLGTVALTVPLSGVVAGGAEKLG